jgi:predicted nucleic acid-binding protein
VKSFILDASIALEWFSKDATPEALARRGLLDDHVALVPALWRFEVMNAITTWLKRGDISTATSAMILNDIMQVPFGILDESSPELIVSLAVTHNLSAYDATYLHLAMTTGDPLATLDRALITAAKKVGVTCL